MSGRDENTAGDEFMRQAALYQRELTAHCYRMLGSVHDAEDAVQETYLRVWRSHESFEGRSSIRTWLYRIATRVCLAVLETRRRRPLPTGLGGPGTDPGGTRVNPEVSWLEPIPDGLTGLDEADPAEVLASRISVRLAFVAVLQHLPPRHRAAVILCDVLKWRASEVAEALGTSTTSINGVLQRARARLLRAGLNEAEMAEPSTDDQRDLLDGYVRAFEGRDVAGLVRLLTADAIWEMPPDLTWFRGREDIGRLLATQCQAQPGELLMIPTAANGQPAFGVYHRDHQGEFKAVALQVLELSKGAVRHVVNFGDLALFSVFGLPLSRFAHHQESRQRR